MSLPIRVGFSTTNYPLSKIIRWFTKSTVSHAFLVYFDKDFGFDCVMEATLGGFRIQPWERFVRHNEIVDVIEPKVPIDIGVQKLAEHLGEGYDYGGLIGMIFVLMGDWLKRKWRNPFASRNAMFCSEAAARALTWTPNYPGIAQLPEPWRCSPKQLLAFMQGSSVDANP